MEGFESTGNGPDGHCYWPLAHDLLFSPLCACAGETRSEGGFAANKVSAASLLDAGTTTDSSGKEYYTFNVITRTGA